MNISENPNHNLNGLFNKHLKKEINNSRKYKKYLRVCKRCGEIYNTTYQRSNICPKCHKPIGGWQKTRNNKTHD